MRSITDSDSKLLRNRLILPDYFTFGPLLQLWSVLKMIVLATAMLGSQWMTPR